VKNFGTVAQRLRKIGCPDRQDHELLDIHTVVGMRTAIDDVHHRNRHGRVLAQVPEQWLAGRLRRGAGCGQRDCEQCVGTQPPLVLGTVEFDHALVERALVFEILADDGVANLAVDVRNSPGHTLAQVARLVAVAQLDRFACSRRRA
jgi:hypothetical protein